MKKTIFTSIAFLIISVAAIAQNVGIGTTTPTNKLEVVSAAATSANAAIHATNTGIMGNAVLGVSNNIGTYGVRGLSNTGTGVQGYTSTGSALVGVSLGGVALFAQSISGYGLIASGKLKFSGGSMNPSDGALLTSDASGNATWKRSGLAFHANSAVNTAIPVSGWTKVEFNNEGYDTQNNFVDYAGAVTAGSSVFTAPVAGIYHFSASVLLEKLNVAQANQIWQGRIMLAIHGTSIEYVTSPGMWRLNNSYCYLYLDVDLHLAANDKISIMVSYDHGGGALATTNSSSYNGRFNGELLFAD